jgi:hypothetical protein
MLELLKYATSGFWVFIGTFILLTSILHYGVNGIIKIISRLIRLAMVSLRGWPDNGLDADGDFKPKD